MLSGLRGSLIFWFLTFQKLVYLPILINFIQRLIFFLFLGIVLCFLQVLFIFDFKKLFILNLTERVN